MKAPRSKVKVQNKPQIPSSNSSGERVLFEVWELGFLWSFELWALSFLGFLWSFELWILSVFQ